MPYIFNAPTQISPTFASTALGESKNIHHAYVDGGIAYYELSTDEGATYSDPVVIGAAKSTELTRPLIVGADGRRHFFYVREIAAADRLMYRFSDDGVTWSAEQELHNGGATGFIYRIDADVLDGIVIVSWVWGQDGIMRLRKSDTNGASWGTSQTPYGTTGLFYRQRVRIMADGKVHLLFTNNPAGSTFLEDDEIRYGYSNDWGDTWQASFLVGGGPNRFALYPDLAALENNILIAAWVEAAEGTSLNDRGVFVRISLNGGTTWQATVQIADFGEKADHMFLASSNNRVALNWVSNRTGTRRTMISTSDDFGTTWRAKQMANTTLVTADSRVEITANYIHVFIITETTFLFYQQRALWNQAIFPVLASADDGSVGRTSSATEYPPAGTIDVFTATTNLIARKIEFGGFGYEILVPLLRFDTSEIPDGAVITSAVLRLQTLSMGLSTRNLQAQYYPNSNWPIDSADWSGADNPGSDAGSFPLSGFAASTQEDLALSNPTSVNKTGYTGLRLSMSGGAPGTSEDHRIEFASFDHATVAEPQLIVEFTMPMQKMAPIADGAVDGWTPSSGGDLYAMLDELTENAADYVQSNMSPDGKKFRIKLAVANPPPPGARTIHLNPFKTAAAGEVHTGLVRLYEGGSTTFDSGTLLQSFNLGALDDVNNTIDLSVTNEISKHWDLWLEYEVDVT